MPAMLARSMRPTVVLEIPRLWTAAMHKDKRMLGIPF